MQTSSARSIVVDVARIVGLRTSLHSRYTSTSNRVSSRCCFESLCARILLTSRSLARSLSLSTRLSVTLAHVRTFSLVRSLSIIHSLLSCCLSYAHQTNHSSFCEVCCDKSGPNCLNLPGTKWDGLWPSICVECGGTLQSERRMRLFPEELSME